TDIAQIAGAVACRNVQAATQRDGEVREIATHPLPFKESLGGRARWPRMPIVERDIPVHEVADGLHPVPSRLQVAEQTPGLGHQYFGIAIATTEQELHDFEWQLPQ